MANEPISALTLFTSYSTADEVEILDVSDTTFASTGTNKRIPFSTLLTMAGVGSGAGGGSGTVTSVGLSLPPFITVTGSPVSTSGTLTGTLATQTANTHFAGPTSGSAAAPTFRALVPAESSASITSGQIGRGRPELLGTPTGALLSPRRAAVSSRGSPTLSRRGSAPIWAATAQASRLPTHILNVGRYRCVRPSAQYDPGEHLHVANRLRFNISLLCRGPTAAEAVRGKFPAHGYHRSWTLIAVRPLTVHSSTTYESP